MKIKNITRYTYESTDFLGWRVSVQRCGRIITRYFSDLEYGTEEEALHAALLYRDYIIQGLRQHSDDLEGFMDEELRHVQDILRNKIIGLK